MEFVGVVVPRHQDKGNSANGFQPQPLEAELLGNFRHWTSDSFRLHYFRLHVSSGIDWQIKQTWRQDSPTDTIYICMIPGSRRGFHSRRRQTRDLWALYSSLEQMAPWWMKMEETEAVRVRKLLLEVESEEQEENTEGGASESDGWPHSETESEHNTESEEDADSVDEDISEIEENSTDFYLDGTGMDIFRTTMSLQRFRFILQCLRFDDKSTRAERSKIDKLAPIRDVFEHFVANCRNNTRKPRKYGIKIFALADSRTFYSSNLEVYTGKQPEGPYNLSNSADAVVERLISRISGSGRNVTVDNWFNSVPLATRLLKDHNLTLLGTLRKNKKELPPEFVQTKNRQIHSSMFGFNGDITLVSHAPKKGKVVLLLSTMHHDDKIDESTGEQKKPDMITSYNTFKGGVDTVDQIDVIVSTHLPMTALDQPTEDNKMETRGSPDSLETFTFQYTIKSIKNQYLSLTLTHMPRVPE
ncbi:hypothetical protein ANN_08694 [Periplaneta americana]|uniref:PiggyBac transposable element-derived protein domain-containing protein n=1 Tax=Periplaneta americana TaxID=6978 RepID=A0ABQ8T261_PERAM|nr:hypothetical protein ANN_08694 [Periplaneta americana]